MIGKTFTITIAAFAMMSQASMAVAAPQGPVGLASNQAALGIPVTAVTAVDTCVPTDGVRIACAADTGSSAFAGRGSSIFVLLAAIAAIGLGIAAAASGSSSPTSP